MIQKEIIDSLLRLYPETRDSNKELVWYYWMYELNRDVIYINELRFCKSVDISKEEYVKLTPYDSITATKRKLKRENDK